MERSKDAEGEGSPREEAAPEILTKWSDEKECYDEIAEYIKEVDEILDFIKPFPRDRCPEPGHAFSRSSSMDSSDHLGNLIKLVEQLKDLKEKDSKMNERTQYLKDLKKLRERKKLLKYEAELGKSSSGFWGDANAEECGKARSSLPFRKTSRGRSKSVNMDEIAKDVRFRRGRFPSDEEQRRKMSAGSQKTDKSKVSKWTKVKEAFRWEKASVEGKGSARREDVHYLQVPQDKTPESLSDSPLSGQVSGSSSVGAPSTICLAVSSGYSGEHSSEGHSTSSGYGMDLPPPPPPLPSEDDFLTLPLIQDLSSSSSSEKLDELLTYSELLAKGNERSDAGDSFDGAFHDVHPTDDHESRRSKSLDGDTVLGPSSSLMQHLSKDSLTYSKKAHKTAWGKVKDIIQTRKDSLKKKPKKRSCEKMGEAFSSQSGLDLEGQEDPSSPEDKSKEILPPKMRIELAEPPEDVAPPSSPVKSTADDPVSKRRLTPVLTITLPSTEELRSMTSGEGVAQKPISAEEKGKAPSDNVEYLEDIPKYEKNKTGHYHRFSKWSKVKRAFLTNPSRSEYVPEASSVPSSPNKQMSFFSDVESDELSSGEWTDYKIQGQEKPAAEAESPGSVFSEDVHKHYLELNNKLTHEFDQKMREWERLKSETKTKTKQEAPLQKQKSEDWDKSPRSMASQRDSMTIPLPKLEELSPEFKKKLDEWKKIKKSRTISAVPGSSPKDEGPGQNFKMRIGEWQRWRSRSNHKMPKGEQSDEFAKKLEEWQRIKGTVRRSRSQSDRGKDDRNRTPSPSLRRKSSKKKTTGSGKSSGTESLGGSLKEKDGRGMSRKQQKEKDMQWLEKELHKIERGKMRLEREKEKFLEREARLEKMKRTMGTTSPTQEILIKTPTGFFRFEGISQKFQKKLYEWEKARGIAPEASTFALLEECASRTEREEHRSNGTSLQRSKSMGSVIEVSSMAQSLPHHPSSLSLNDVDELDVDGIGESRASSEPTLAHEEDEPQAIIVDVEDVVEETAALMADVPEVKGEVPVYSYAPAEVTQLIDSSGSENESEIRIMGQAERKYTEPEVLGATSRKEESGYEKVEDDQSGKHLQLTGPDGLDQREAVTRVHQLSSQLLCLAEKLELALSERSEDGKATPSSLCPRRKQANCLTGDERRGEEKELDAAGKPSAQELVQLPSLITNKVLELKCGLNVLKSAAESPAPETPVLGFANRIREHETVDVSYRRSRRRDEVIEEEPSRNLQKSKAQLLYGRAASQEYDRQQTELNSPELIKRKIKEKISLMQRMTTEARPRNFQLDQEEGGGDVEEKVVVVRKNCKETKQKKLLKTRRVTDTTITCKQVIEENRFAPGKDDDVVKTSKSYAIPVNSQRFTEDGAMPDKAPVNVFVPTTRKIISPVRRDSKGTTSIVSYVIDDVAPMKEEENLNPKSSASPGVVRKSEPDKQSSDIGIPPLPNSPLSPRKLTSPGIRMIIAKYSQKIEQTTGSDTERSSPSWRSPVFNRKRQETGNEVQKSASLGLVPNQEGRKTPQESPKGVMKSSSLGAMKPETAEVKDPEMTTSSLRALRLKKAKEEFLARGPGGEGWTSAASTPTTESPTNRLSHVSIGSEASNDAFDSNLIKSASAGTINMEDARRRSSDMDRSDESSKAEAKSSFKFGISSIKSRFRKVRMKRGKEKDGGAVSTLCRQSLLLEVPIGLDHAASACTSKSCPSSPVLERSKPRTDSWIRLPTRKVFKGKDPKPETP